MKKLIIKSEFIIKNYKDLDTFDSHAIIGSQYLIDSENNDSFEIKRQIVPYIGLKNVDIKISKSQSNNYEIIEFPGFYEEANNDLHEIEEALRDNNFARYFVDSYDNPGESLWKKSKTVIKDNIAVDRKNITIIFSNTFESTNEGEVFQLLYNITLIEVTIYKKVRTKVFTRLIDFIHFIKKEKI